MRRLLVGLVCALTACAPRESAPVSPAEPKALAAQVAARSGLLIEHARKADMRRELCESALYAEQEATRAAQSAHDAELAALRAQLAERDAALAVLQATLNDQTELAKLRGQQVVKAFSGCHEANDRAAQLARERDKCYLQLAGK